MKKENIFNTKKNYNTPEMNVVELKHKSSLLDCSSGGECGEPSPYGGDNPAG